MRDIPPFLRKKRNPLDPVKLDDATQAYQPLLASWLIEMALCFGWAKKPYANRLPEIFTDSDFLTVTGIELPGERDEDGDLIMSSASIKKMTEAMLTRHLKRRLRELSQLPLAGDLPLFANAELLGRLLGLSDAEKAVLVIAVALNAFGSFKSAISSRYEKMSNPRLAQLIVLLSGQSEADIQAALREDAPLSATGIVKVDQRVCDFEEKFDLMQGLGGILLAPHVCEEDLVDRFLKRTDAPTLTLDAFPHLARDIAVLGDYLAHALRAGETGTNVLFYGPPGTGKTELVKALAAALGVELYEIAFADEDGDPIKGLGRLRAYNLCQRLLVRKANALLMFDEIEDVFPSRSIFAFLFGGGEEVATKSSGKAWINRTLERNATPAIWVTNDAALDPAYLRRFDYSVRFPIPPQAVRMTIARYHLAPFAPSDEWLARIAASEQTCPAQYERAAKVARVASGGDPARAAQLVEQTLERSARLLGQRHVPPRTPRRTGYDLAFLNTDVDVNRVVGGLRRRPHGTFCFYGPAGTGKSELVRHMADAIGRPLLVRRASDLLSKWVGETEQHLAAMFAEAREQEAVLVLDEADSFLGDRREAHNRWEATQVNELLTQMEAFEGVFVCTTNLMERLDAASLRRFAFKVKFDYLTAAQRWQMFGRELARLGGDVATAGEWETAVRRLERLTPGDFAVAARQFELWDSSATAASLYTQLRKECEAKGASPRPIGFCS